MEEFRAQFRQMHRSELRDQAFVFCDDDERRSAEVEAAYSPVRQVRRATRGQHMRHVWPDFLERGVGLQVAVKLSTIAILSKAVYGCSSGLLPRYVSG